MREGVYPWLDASKESHPLPQVDAGPAAAGLERPAAVLGVREQQALAPTQHICYRLYCTK